MKMFGKTRFFWGVLVVATLLVVWWWASMIGFAEPKEWNQVVVDPASQLQPPRIGRRATAIAPPGGDRESNAKEPSEILHLQLRWPDGRALAESVTGYFGIPGQLDRFKFKTDSSGAADIAFRVVPKRVEISWSWPMIIEQFNLHVLDDDAGYVPTQTVDVNSDPNPEVSLIARPYAQFRGRVCTSDPGLVLEGIRINNDQILHWDYTSANGEFAFRRLIQGLNRLSISGSGFGARTQIFDQEALAHRYGRLKSGMAESEILKELRAGPKLSADGMYFCFDARYDDACPRYWLDLKAAPRIEGAVMTAGPVGAPIPGVEIRILNLGPTPVPFTQFSLDPFASSYLNSFDFPRNQKSGLSISDEDGRFALASIFADDCILEFRAKGYGVYWTPVIRMGTFSAADPLVVRLSRTRVEIETWFVGRKSLNDMRVTLYRGGVDSIPVSSNQFVVRSLKVVGKTAVFENCAPGDYVLKISGTNAKGQRVESAPRSLSIEPGDDVKFIRLRLPR